MTWFAEFRHADDETGQWMRLGVSRKTRERAKADAKAHKEALPHLRMKARYRIVMDDPRQTVEEVSEPPHGWRMRWRWTPLPNTVVRGAALGPRTSPPTGSTP